MLISTKPIYSEEYKVKYWYKDTEDNFHKQGEIRLWTSSRSSHKQVEKFTRNYLGNLADLRIISVTYQ